MSTPDAAPRHAFDDSRRLIGANRWTAGPAVTLVPLGPAAADGAAQGRWIAQVVATCAALGWPEPDPRVQLHAQGQIFVFAAPAEALFTATEVNEWAWERAAAAHPAHAAAGFDLAQPPLDDAREHFRARAAAERSRPLQRLVAAAAAHGVPLLADDDTVSVGEGRRSRVFARAALPLPQDLPWPELGAVPKVLVTGSNGKTTTTRLIAAIARAAGFVPGLSSTEGVVVGGTLVAPGDWSGPAGARAVLRHPEVTAAVLETARGGLLRRGLAVAQADVAVVTNVSADHLGEQGIDTVEDIAFVKLAVAHALARPAAHAGNGPGMLVLNGQCDPLLRVAVHLRHSAQARWALFAREHAAPMLAALRRHGGSTCGEHDGRLVLTLAGIEHDLGAVAAMPLALGGAAGHNIENLAAAALAAAALGWPLDEVREVFSRFGADPADNPGRLERHAWRGATVLVDYAHNPDGLAQLLAVAQALRPADGAGRLLLLLGQAGNRDDEALAALAQVAAAARPDLVVLKELTAMLRGRAPGAVPARLREGLLAAGLPASAVSTGSRGEVGDEVGDEEAAAGQLLDAAASGDVLVLPLHTPAVRAAVVARLRAGA